MAAAYAASHDPDVMSWTLRVRGRKLSRYASNYTSAVLRTQVGETIGAPSATMIGRVSLAAARRQLASNLSIVRRVLGKNLLAAATTVVPVSASTFGLEVDLKLRSLRAVQPHLGDAFLGPRTGLVFGPTAAIEGLAVNLVDVCGARAGQWLNGRDGNAGGEGNPVLNFDDLRPDTAFPDLTGGPPLTVTPSSGAQRFGAPGAQITVTRRR